MFRRTHDVSPLGSLHSFARGVAIDLLELERETGVDHIEITVSRRGAESIRIRGCKGVGTVFEDEWKKGGVA